MARRENTKQKIAVVAWKLFHERGYDNTTVDDILEAANTSKGSFYHYYSGKDALLISLSEVFDSKYEEIVQELPKDMNSYDKLLHLCFTVHDFIDKEIPVDLLASLYSSQVTTKGDKHLVNRNRYFYKLVNEIVDEGQRRGQITRKLTYYEVAQLYIMCERAIIYEYCISNAAESLSDLTHKYMPLMFSSVKAEEGEETT